MISFVGDQPADLTVRLFTDADFAGEQSDSKSTSGTFLCLSGPNTLAPQAAQSKKQSAVSHSTPEAEIVSADHGVRTEGLPALDLWEVILDRKLILQFEEDNSAAKRVIDTGRNPTMRHLNRTHKVDLRFLHEQVEQGNMIVNQCPTAEMAADVLTKAFTNEDKWKHACSLIGHTKLNEISWTDPRPASSKSEPKGPATPASQGNTRVIIEFCCGDDYKIGKFAMHAEGCDSKRLTIAEDLTTDEGLAIALKWIKEAKDRGETILLWAAIPCTGGSPWQNYNRRFPSAAAKIRVHIKVFNKLFDNFMITAREVIQCGGIVVNEWPERCAYWRFPKVKAFFNEIMVRSVTVHGCSFDLKSIRVPSKYIYKPWRLDSSNHEFLEPFVPHVCPGESETHQHVPCAGKDTKRTEEYTNMFAKLVVKSFSNVSNVSKTTQKNKSAFVACAVRAENVRSRNQSSPKPNLKTVTLQHSYSTNSTCTVSYTHLTLPTKRIV